MYNKNMNKKEMLDLRLQGQTYEAIATQAGISRQRVQQLLSPPRAVRDYVVKKHDGRCKECGLIVGKSGHVHHVGSNGENYNDIDNLQLLCISCHRRKHYIESPHVCYIETIGGCTMPTKDSRVIGVRISTDTIMQVKKRASRRGWTFNKWMNWSITQGLRLHKKV